MIKLILSAIFLLSCTTIRFVDDKGLEKKSLVAPAFFKYEQELEFYLWGLLPDEHVVDITALLKERGYQEVSKISYEDYRDFSQILLIGLTFGMYMPKNYVVKGYYEKNRE